MSAAAMSSPPIVPPRPARNPEKANGTAPTIPARPTKRFNRSVSPNPDRFAPSPLNESPFASKAKRNSQSLLGEELERSTSVDLPGVGEEGKEYAAAIEELVSTSPDENRTSSPEQTRIVDEGLKLHAPKPTVPAASAEKRVAAVTRTDSDRAAAFGIGRPSSEEPLHSGARSLKKKASTTSQLSHHSELYTDDEHGIPEIGQRVPMLSYAGDVQAPSPAPRASSVDSTKSGRHHSRRTSSRNGFHDLPPGSYGLHGHGIESTDKLEKAYYEKHPEIYQKEHYHPLHERVHDYSMSSENLNKIVRDTASRGVGSGTSGYIGTPSEQVGFQASDEYTSRISSPQPSSAAPKAESVKSSTETTGVNDKRGDNVIHIDEDSQYKGFAKYGDNGSEDHDLHNEGSWPILAADEVAKDPSSYELQPAIPPNRRGSDELRSRPSSRPASIYSPPPPEVRSTPLEDVEEYEPLFPDDEKGDHKPKTSAEKLKEHNKRFPSRDIWEDAPNSVHSTAEVSTPEPPDTRPKSRTALADLPPRDTETPAQAFARRQEELAEKEAITPDSFLNRQQQRPKSWVEHQPHLAKELHSRPIVTQRFPSRDVWEDTPDSLQFTTTVSTPQSADDSAADEETKPQPPANRPTIPSRPPKKQGSGDDGASKPVVPHRPKPQIPTRPVKPVVDAKEPEGAAKPKPVVPARPVGGKIAALQAGFMSDLNNRLRLGPQAPPPKKEKSSEEVPEEKEKAPLADARKGRARGPQRRAPTKSHSPGIDKSAPPPVSNGHPVLSFSMTRTLWSIDEEGTVTVDNFGQEKARNPEPTVKEVEPEADEVKAVETKPDQTPAEETEGVETKSEETPEQKEPEKITEETEKTEKTETTETTTTDDKPSETQDTVEEAKSLVTNTAGEPILTETVEKKEEGDEVKEVEEAKDEVIS
ncbi:altered inheritance of mitochondria protein 21 [Xylaria sp. FL1042]|nr:altered inheritance of mitochondria protein 21 [Xylaria sp. FL1042]